MADREQPYDPYIPNGQGGSSGSGGARDGNQRTAALQAVRTSLLSLPLLEPVSAHASA